MTWLEYYYRHAELLAELRNAGIPQPEWDYMLIRSSVYATQAGARQIAVMELALQEATQ